MGGAWDQRQRWPALQLGREREKGKAALSTLVSSHPLCHQKGSSSFLAAAPNNQTGKVCGLLAGVLVSYPRSKTNAALVTDNFPASPHSLSPMLQPNPATAQERTPLPHPVPSQRDLFKPVTGPLS